MRFVVDAQLPPRLASFLVGRGHEAVHVQDLAGGVMTSDADLAAFADAGGAVVVTKDADFRHAQAAAGSPRVLLLIVTGNISNPELLALFDERIEDLVGAFADSDLVEVRRDLLVIHRRR